MSEGLPCPTRCLWISRETRGPVHAFQNRGPGLQAVKPPANALLLPVFGFQEIRRREGLQRLRRFSPRETESQAIILERYRWALIHSFQVKMRTLLGRPRPSFMN